MNERKKMHLVSLGCAKNLVDSEVMIGLVSQGGWAYTEDPEEADAIIINTCAFIGPAREESVDTVLEYARYKSNGRASRLVVTGCLAQKYPGELESLMPEVDKFLGSGEFHHIVEALEGVGSEKSRIAQPEYLYDENAPRTLSTHPNWAYVKIAEGCDQLCSFCIIPALRGSFRSRTIESVAAEAEALGRRGVREINLVSQDATQYGKDLASSADLAQLLRTLDQVESIDWLRLFYAYPIGFTPELIRTISESQRIVPYVDMPIQHISDRVLGRMRRRVNGSQVRKLLEEIREGIPGVAIRTTLLVGFPGETEAEFEELLSFVGEFGFDHLGVFPYSHEEGTPSAELDGALDEEIKHERAARIMERQQSVAQRKANEIIGSTARIFIEGPADEPDVWVGRSALQGPEIDSVTYVNAEALEIGSIIECKIVGAGEYDSIAEPTTDGR